MKPAHFLSAGLLILSFIYCTQQNEYRSKSVNPEITKEASYLLDFLYEIDGKNILSGHHNYINNPTQYFDSLNKITGNLPVVWGCDFMFNYESEQEADSIRQSMVDLAVELNDKGHIITLMWHACFPTDGDTCGSEGIWTWDDIVSDEEWKELTTPGTVLNSLWKTQVDKVAGFLLQLQEAEVPVLWRPYHEMNGVWFWWCRHPGGEGYIKLWKMMYEYLTDYHKINNLIWVWNPNAPRDKKGDEAYAYADYFPGLDYVDVLAADVYHNDYKQSHHDQLIKLAKGKPIALGEVGRMPTPKILEQQPKWTWFMGWANWLYKSNDPDSVNVLYNSEKVLLLNDIEKNEEGIYSVTKQY